ncbi:MULTISPECIES: insulinase family protein [unclassified Colwellia]|uniref:insulinase family protein n=1 Tax=unclassified Colwellia TaxID=196834 RepID=UPI0015F70E3D|nr:MULTISPECIES: insulinase family protein [unclassified Colwellia]MBA6255702.1 insulinase family protein [Colwellia sp. MB3u-28]MBA6261843.1 insulinase family protein [Colwellia sp. MB3u-41]
MKQSPNDSKQYKTLTLSNGLRVLLIHNEQTNKSAAALAVNIGHFSDPKDREGLAHFLEHMLFLGTESYPDGSEYQKYISQHGGSNNAWTATEHTCFFFDIHHQHFTFALDRFSQFFISPLLSREFVEKERQNVDAEFKLKLKDDIRRLYDVHKETINQAHPFSKFSVGSIDTLADRKDSDLTTEIRDFFHQYYRANIMTLVLEGPQSLDELVQLATSKFTDIKAATSIPPVINTPLYLAEHQQIKINVKPVKNDRQLIVSFAMPSIDRYYRHKPESILAYLLGHEGGGSILSYLKKQRWALSLTAGSGVNGANFKDFNLSISLTELGEQHINEIISCIFSYINVMKSTPIDDFYYQEKQAIANLSFNYQEKLKPLDSVCQLVINMQHYSPDDYIYGDYIMNGMQQQTFSLLLGYLSANNMRVIHISAQNTFDKKSFWYQVPFSIEKISPMQITNWENEAITHDLSLPLSNPYIVKSPKIYASTPVSKQHKSTPDLIEKIDGLSIWFKQDNTFRVPKGYIYIGIDAPLTIKDSKHIAMTRLFVDLYSDAVIEQHYDAELAGIHYHLFSHQGGMTLQLSGVSTKQDKLLEQLLLSLVTASFIEEKFELFKKQLINHWHNAQTSKSISQLFSILSSTMQPKNPTSNELANALENTSFKEFTAFRKHLFDGITIEALMHGNWVPEHALKFSEQLKAAFSHHYSDKYAVNVPVLDIEDQGDIHLPLHLPEHDHAVVIYYPFSKKDLKTIAITMITSQVLSPLFFQEMRTDKQFGYLVGVGFIPINRYPGIAFYIQSPHINADVLVTEINGFINQSLEKLTLFSDDDWLHIQQGLASQLQEKDSSLRIKSQRFWAAICNKETNFDEKQQLIQVILSLTVNDISHFFTEQLLVNNNTDRITLTSYPDSTEEKIKISLQHNEKIRKRLKKCQRKY